MLRVAVARVVDASRAGESAASRALLRELLQAATGVQASAWHVSEPAGIAPVAHVASAAHAGPVHVSLSHRLGWVAAAVSDALVGIDIECERPPRSEAAERAALMLSPSELRAWSALGLAEREPALLTLWTAKEAWYKASPPGAVPWDFRRIVARPCPPHDAAFNVRTWASSPLHVAVCCGDARALAAIDCGGLSPTSSSAWTLRRVCPAH